MAEKRQFERATFDGAVEIEHGSERWSGRLRDLSVGGAFVISDRAVAFGQPVRMWIALPALTERGRPPAEIEGIVRWVRPEGFGVQFGPTGAMATFALADFVARQHGGL
jgi:hypothetical protein